MNILIDTNIVISLEPTSPDDVEPRTGVAADFVRVVSEGGDRLLLHPASLQELAGDADPVRRGMRDVLLKKYGRLDPPPAMAQAVLDELGEADAASHDYVDHLVLSTVVMNAVQYLVTDDGGIHTKAARLGVGERVFTVEDALGLLTTLLRRTPEPPPLVVPTKSYDLDLADPIFDSFRGEYPGFDEWFINCQREHRPGWVIRDPAGLAAVCIIKEDNDELHLGGPTLKICSLKVSEERAGRRYGELLLKMLFSYLDENGYEFAFLTVFAHHQGLISLLEDFGFVRHEPDKASTGERYYVKSLGPIDQERAAMSPLDFHVRFGPPAVKLDEVFLVPIQPKYHRLLFPDAEPQDEPQQLELDLVGVPSAEPKPFGNALRKAYLCHTPSRQLGPGAAILFYRSHDAMAITSVGVVEQTLVSSDATEVAEFVGQRSVYSLEEIAELCAEGEVVAIRFRQDRLLDAPIEREEMVDNGLAKQHPQSVQAVSSEVIPWLTGRIGG
jgi:ribosomal protein S18 acetylase RimI-like enzyme